MASVFTYETDPVRVASPWPRAPTLGQEATSDSGSSSLPVPPAESLCDYGISKLIPEPQEGPVEYKLHLLLRPRRSFSATSTVQKVSGSHLSKSRGPSSASDGSPRSGSSTPVLAPSNVSRQNRLQHLTTQLLWRLQQSSPHHASSKSDLILPMLPEPEVQISVSKGPGKLIAGLEESLGVLYEIGVSDDGSFVGLTRDELDESLTVLRAMSYSLGCHLQVLRMVDVGNCQWSEEVEARMKQSLRIRKERLWVAEVLIGPNAGLNQGRSKSLMSLRTNGSSNIQTNLPVSKNGTSNNADQQLRVTLTGSTTSGKSSLLGTLSTSTLDNGRGKSRLSLLKHRHEIVSGVTSSLAQELVGYQDIGSGKGSKCATTQIVNYASANVSSWNDIHNIAHPGRLVFVTDSAGHPRYRRTTVRGVISWAPHWTLCCVAADDNEDNTGKVGATASASDILGSSGQGIDLSKAHLDLCLKLGLPLVVIITKYDLASRTGLRQTLTKVLSTLKDAGRRPAMLSLDAPNDVHRVPFQGMSSADTEIAKKVIASVAAYELHLLVPIVLTSAVTGTGISKIHSLLRHLPIFPSAPEPIARNLRDASPVFHIDEVFTMAKLDFSKLTSDFIVSGYLRHGTLGVGDYVLVGPFTIGAPAEHSETFDRSYASSYPDSRRGSPKSPQLRSKCQRILADNLTDLVGSLEADSDVTITWHMVTVASIRNLRLPVRKLRAGQVATIAINFINLPLSHAKGGESTVAPALRRGMVLLPPLGDGGGSPPAFSSFTAIFDEPNTYVIPGSSVTIYTASIRASARIVEVRVPDTKTSSDEVFDFDNDNEDASTLTDSVSTIAEKEMKIEAIEITFKFSSSREWIELGTKVLVTPASGLSMLNPLEHGETGSVGAGLDAFVGKIVSTGA